MVIIAGGFSMDVWRFVSSLGAAFVVLAAGGDAEAGRPPSPLAGIDSRVLTAAESAGAGGMVRAEIRARTRLANLREDDAWAKVTSIADWERFRDARLTALRRSLGGSLAWADRPVGKPAPRVEVTGVVSGEGFRIRNLVIAGRPFLPITGNLYVPHPPRAEPTPGILICTSHHNAKTQGELLDMGMTWARAGAMVLVLDNLGYAERRQQPYGGREDYRWRYYLGMQLYTVGESLIGWMVDDLHRGIDVLLAQPGVDSERIIAIGSVAGGGDPVAVLGAFDRRIRCVIPFNFGSAWARKGPGDGEWVNYVGGGDFETTRCLRNSARDGFVPWVLVAGAAPRHVIFAKEFGWNAAEDRGFGRVAEVLNLYRARDRLDSIHGWGAVTGSSRKASHASNVGPPHRKAIYPILRRWLKMPVPREYRKRVAYAALTCMTAEAKAGFPQRKVHEIAAEMAAKRLAAVRAVLSALPAADRRKGLRRDWARVLGGVRPVGVPKVERTQRAVVGTVTVEKVLLAPEAGILVPMLVLTPRAAGAEGRPPVVVCVSQEGKGTFLKKRAVEVAGLLARGLAVCLPDLRGTGETEIKGTRYWYGPPVLTAAEELMLGGTMLGSRLRDLRAVLRFLEARTDLDGRRVGVWGESFAGVNPQVYVDPPMQTKQDPELGEPLGAHVALLAGLYEHNVRAVLARGGLVGFSALMDGPACHLVLDAVVPQVLEAGDLADVAAALAPAPLRIEAAVDGRNRLATLERLKADYAPARAAYSSASDRLQLSPSRSGDTAAWLAAALDGD
jgi:dienelactone hydrolase